MSTPTVEPWETPGTKGSWGSTGGRTTTLTYFNPVPSDTYLDPIVGGGTGRRSGSLRAKVGVSSDLGLKTYCRSKRTP